VAEGLLGRSKAATIESGWWSFTRLISIDVKPKTVVRPPAVAMSVGRAKNAR
jgi:hypothetical protein